jgi:murein DD-endopeptidase MepM/ murein hydrolase activator NlpD
MGSMLSRVSRVVAIGVTVAAVVSLAGCKTSTHAGIQPRFQPRPPPRFEERNVLAIWPVEAPSTAVKGRFGLRNDPFTGKIQQHNGVDIAAPKGTPVVAAGAGRVTYADENGGFGRIIRIDHGSGIETWYAHLESFAAKPDDRVKRGQRIGSVGATGRATGPHLHYEVHVNGRPVDPEPFLPPERYAHSSMTSRAN